MLNHHVEELCCHVCSLCISQAPQGVVEAFKFMRHNIWPLLDCTLVPTILVWCVSPFSPHIEVLWSFGICEKVLYCCYNSSLGGGVCHKMYTETGFGIFGIKGQKEFLCWDSLSYYLTSLLLFTWSTSFLKAYDMQSTDEPMISV